MSISDVSNPWSNADASNLNSSEDSGWADFGGFSTDFPTTVPSSVSPTKKNSDNSNGSDTDDEIFVCASDTVPPNAPEPAAVDTSQSQPCT